MILGIGFWVLVSENKIYRESDMKPELKELAKKIKALDEKIVDVKKRMPAHSIKPPIMMELFALEDERDALEKQIHQLKKNTKT